jgi:hypothetical protein
MLLQIFGCLGQNPIIGNDFERSQAGPAGVGGRMPGIAYRPIYGTAPQTQGEADPVPRRLRTEQRTARTDHTR